MREQRYVAHASDCMLWHTTHPHVMCIFQISKACVGQKQQTHTADWSHGWTQTERQTLLPRSYMFPAKHLPQSHSAAGLFTPSWYRAVEPWAQKSHAAEPGSSRAYRAV